MTNTSPAFQILLPQSTDLPFIQAIYEQAVLTGTASFELTPPDLTEMTQRYHALVDHGFPYFVAKDSTGHVLGYAYASLYRARPAYRFTVEDSIYIAPEAQGLGIGRALLSRVIADATDKGFRQMIAVIGDSQHKASIALHQRLGFEHSGVFRDIGWKQNRWLDTVLMQRFLGEGARTPAES
ncbi:MAG: GNAT family N-acetyltransferase [Alphaproteobacteria bacterium]|nr:GNAT family N-acetyltransferase [Alphaproteobacteria bacterium]